METSRSGLSLTDELTISMWPQGLCSHASGAVLVGLQQICSKVVMNTIREEWLKMINMLFDYFLGVQLQVLCFVSDCIM